MGTQSSRVLGIVLKLLIVAPVWRETGEAENP